MISIWKKKNKITKRSYLPYAPTKTPTPNNSGSSVHNKYTKPKIKRFETQDAALSLSLSLTISRSRNHGHLHTPSDPIPFLSPPPQTLWLGPSNLRRDPHYRHHRRHLQKQKPFDNRRHSVKTDGWDLLNRRNFPRKSVTGVHVSSSSAASNESLARVAAIPAGFPRSCTGAYSYRRRRWRHPRSNGLPHQHTFI